MYYPCSENKGADQLRGYREADLRLCFRIGKNPVFSRCGSLHQALRADSVMACSLDLRGANNKIAADCIRLFL